MCLVKMMKIMTTMMMILRVTVLTHWVSLSGQRMRLMRLRHEFRYSPVWFADLTFLSHTLTMIPLLPHKPSALLLTLLLTHKVFIPKPMRLRLTLNMSNSKEMMDIWMNSLMTTTQPVMKQQNLKTMMSLRQIFPLKFRVQTSFQFNLLILMTTLKVLQHLT